MKVAEDTTQRLIIEDRPIALSLFLLLMVLAFGAVGAALLFRGEIWGLMFIVIGSGIPFGFMFLFVRRVQVVFDRTENRVDFHRKNLLRSRHHDLPLADIARAELQVSKNLKGPDNYRAALVVDAGPNAGHHPITIAYTSGNDHARCVEAINTWLRQ